MACQLDEHPLVADIDELLRSGAKYGQIRLLCLEKNESVPSRPTLSRHSKHIGLPSRRPESEPPVPSEPPYVPETSEARDLALAEFYRRLRDDPRSIKTSELVPILTQILRADAAKESKRDPIDDILNQL